MTINQHSVWANATVYQNPDAADTPQETRPNNAAGAVDHFSKRVTLRKYTAPEGWQCNGLAVAGEPELIDFWCAIKPATSRSKVNRTILDEGGEYIEGEWLLFYNPYHAKHPADGIHLQQSSDVSDYSGFADVIEYQDALWIVREHQRLDIDYGENEKLYVGKATIVRWADPVHTSTSDDSKASSGHYQLR